MITLKQLRLSRGISAKELSGAFDVDAQTIYNNEKDSSNIKDSLLSKYLYAFNVGYDDIFLGDKYEIFVFEKKAKEEILLRGREQKRLK